MDKGNSVDNEKLIEMEKRYGDKLIGLSKEKLWDYRRALKALSDTEISDVNDDLRHDGYNVQERFKFVEYMFRKHFA